MVLYSKNADFEMLGFHTADMQLFPNIVNIEIFRGNCQCVCTHCPVGATKFSDREKKFGVQHMDLELYKKIASEVDKYQHSALRFHSVGEPLFWNSLPEALVFAAERQIKTWIFTNGLTRDQSLLEYICRYAKIIEISINSIDAKDYEETKGVDAFDQAVSNIKWMRDVILKNKFSTRMIVSRVESDNKELDQRFISHWKESGLVDDVIVRSYHSYNGLIDSKPKQNLLLCREPCLVHWARFNIGVNGDVVICFNELFKDSMKPASILGNVKNQTIKEIWQSTKFNNIRKSELSQDCSACQDWDQLPCRHCNSHQPLQSERKSSEHQIGKLE